MEMRFCYKSVPSIDDGPSIGIDLPRPVARSVGCLSRPINLLQTSAAGRSIYFRSLIQRERAHFCYTSGGASSPEQCAKQRPRSFGQPHHRSCITSENSRQRDNNNNQTTDDALNRASLWSGGQSISLLPLGRLSSRWHHGRAFI